MKITVYRGTDRTGGCVTEYESNGWKLFVDYGEQLSGEPVFNNALNRRPDLRRSKQKRVADNSLSRRSYWQNC